MPDKFKIRPEIRDWKIFSSGASAAGFSFSFLRDEKGQDYPKDLIADYRYSISLPVPEYLFLSAQSFEPFVLRSESIILLFGKSNEINQQVRIFSNTIHPKGLDMISKKVMHNLIQQYGFHKTLSIFRPQDYAVVGESVFPDTTVKFSLRRWTLTGKQMEDITVLAGPQKEEIEFEINPEGLLTFDLILFEEEDKKQYVLTLVSEIGTRMDISGNSSTAKQNPAKAESTKSISTRGR